MIWYLKQLLPLTYVSQYGQLDENDELVASFVTVWQMWFGRCFGIRTWQVVKQDS